MFPTEIVPASTFRQNLKMFFENLCSSRGPLLITRKKEEDIVMIPAAEFRAWEETLYLIQSPKNALMLNKALEQEKNGEIIYRDLLDDEE